MFELRPHPPSRSYSKLQSNRLVSDVGFVDDGRRLSSRQGMKKQKRSHTLKYVFRKGYLYIPCKSKTIERMVFKGTERKLPLLHIYIYIYLNLSGGVSNNGGPYSWWGESSQTVPRGLRNRSWFQDLHGAPGPHPILWGFGTCDEDGGFIVLICY